MMMKDLGFSKVIQLFSRRSGGIRRRLLAWGLTLLGIALIGNTLAGSIYTRRLLRQGAAELQSELASRVALEIEEFIRRKVERLLDFSASASLYEPGGEEQRLLVFLLLKNDRAFTEASILDRNGMEVLKVSERRVYFPGELVDQSGAEKYKVAIKGGNYISPVYTSDKVEPYVTMAVPLKVTPQEIVGVLTVEANLKILWEVIGEIEFGRAGYAYLVDGRGNLIAHRDPSLVLRRTNLSRLHQIQEFLRNPSGPDPSPGGEDQGIAGQPVLSTFAPVQGLGWAVILEEPADMALAEVKKVERYAFLLLGVGMIVGALVIVWVGNRITRPILELHRGAEVIGGGNLHHRVEINTGDEIEQLAQGFNKMAGQLQTSYSTLERRVEQRTSELAALYDVTATVNQSLELETVLQEVIKKVSAIFRFDVTRVFLLNPQTDELHLRASFESRPEFFYQVGFFRRGQGVIGKVAETGEPLIFEDALTDPRYQELSMTKVTQKAGLSFFAAFPIKAGGKCVGTILFIGAKPRKLTAEEIRLLTSMADQIGVAVENTMLFEETVTRANELSALYDVTATVNQSLELDTVLQEVVKRISEILRFDATRIFLSMDRPDQVKLRASFESDPSFSLPVGNVHSLGGLVGRVMATGEPLIFEHIQNDPRYRELSQIKMAEKSGHNFLATFPLKARLRSVGAIVCVGRRPRQLTADEVRLVTSMADQIGVAVENTTLFEETVARARELAALYDVAATLSQSLEPDVVLKEVIHKILEATHFNAARIYLLTPDGQELKLKAHEGISPEWASRMATYSASATSGIEGATVTEGKTVFFEDVQTDPRYAAVARTKTTQKAGFRAFLIIPLKAKEKVIGAMSFLSYKAHNFSAKDIALFTSMANQIAVALENANLFEETVKGAQQLSALYTVTSTVNQSLDLEQVLQEVITKMTEIFHFDTTRIYLFDPPTDELRLRASYPLDREDMNRVRLFRRGQGIVGKVAESGEPLIFENLRSDPRYRELSSTKNTQQTGNNFFAAFPVMAKLRSVGAIVCNGKVPRHLTPDEIQLITSMADQIGVAVENANLFYETKQKSIDLEKTNIELLEANRAKADFLAAMSHELRTPLNVIIGNADLVKDGMFGEITGKQRDALGKILHYSETLLKLINDVLTLTKVEARKVSLSVSTFHVDEIITHTQSYVEQLNRNGRLKVLWEMEPNLPRMTTDALKLEEILQNLIGNAFKFTPEGSIEVRVRDLKGRGRVEFSVADSGIGIASGDLDKIFEQFHQLKEAHTGSYSGVGLGLSIVKRYLEMMQGQIRVESQPGKGSTFIFDLPYSIQ